MILKMGEIFVKFLEFFGTDIVKIIFTKSIICSIISFVKYILGGKMKKGIVIVLAIVLSFAILTVGNNFADSVAASGSAGGQTLTATEKGFGGDVTVTVTVDGDKIVDVKAEGPDETEGIGSMAIDELPAK